MANNTGKKFGGREKGTSNKITSELRTVLKNTLYTQFESLSDYLETLENKEKWELIVKLIPYVMPKVESVKYNNSEPFTSDIW